MRRNDARAQLLGQVRFLTLYEWDEDKRQSNIDKHGIDFESMYDFEWETAVTEPSPRGGEMRYIGIGYIGDRLRTVIYT